MFNSFPTNMPLKFKNKKVGEHFSFSFSFLTTSNFGFISVGVDGALSSSFTIPPPPLFYFIVLLHCCTVHTRPHYTILFGLATTVTCVSPALSSIASKRAIQDTHEIDKAETELRSLRTIDPAPVLIRHSSRQNI